MKGFTLVALVSFVICAQVCFQNFTGKFLKDIQIFHDLFKDLNLSYPGQRGTKISSAHADLKKRV